MEKVIKTGVIKQLSVAFARENRVALAVGTAFGGFVPTATYIVAHYEAAASPLKWILVVGGLAYSATTVFSWGRVAFESRAKAAGFVIILEGTAIVSNTQTLSLFALGCLILVNAAATACSLASEERTKSRLAKTKSTTRKQSLPTTKITSLQKVA